MADGVFLRLRDHKVRLKWHRLRREKSDPVFTAKRLREGLALGASLEVDLQLHAGGGFAVLHEETLERETTGRGPVAAASLEYLRSLHIRGEDGAATSEPVLVFEDLCGMVRGRAARGARLQLDCKETADRLTPAAVAGFSDAIGASGTGMIVSGGDWTAVSRLAASAPGLRRGFDPCDLSEAARLSSALDFAAFVALTERIAPEAAIIYLAYPLILAAAETGYDIVDAFHRLGQEVDAWTLNLDHPNAAVSLRRLVEARVDQITTDEPLAMERLWQRIAPT